MLHAEKIGIQGKRNSQSYDGGTTVEGSGHIFPLVVVVSRGERT